jgi:hypothetical protein
VAERPGEFVLIEKSNEKLPEAVDISDESDFPPVVAALVVCVFGVAQLFVFLLSAASCLGGCSNSFLAPLLMLGILGAGALFFMRLALRGFASAGSFGQLLTCVLLVPSLISVAGASIFVLAVVGLLWSGVRHVLG